VSRASMRFVPMKNGEQQAVLALHRARQGFVRARTAQANQIRGLLAEYGMIIPQGLCQICNSLTRSPQPISSRVDAGLTRASTIIDRPRGSCSVPCLEVLDHTLILLAGFT
jgi:transposase